MTLQTTTTTTIAMIFFFDNLEPEDPSEVDVVLPVYSKVPYSPESSPSVEDEDEEDEDEDEAAELVSEEEEDEESDEIEADRESPVIGIDLSIK